MLLRAPLLLALLAAVALPAAPAAAQPQVFHADHLFVADATAGVIQEYDASGAYLREFPSLGGQMARLTLGADMRLWGCDLTSGSIRVYDVHGNQVEEIGSGGVFNQPAAVAWGPTGHLYIAVAGDDAVLEIEPSGAIVRTYGTGTSLSAPQDLAFGADGHLFVTSSGTDSVFEFDATGTLVREYTGEGMLTGARALALGMDGTIYVGTSGAQQIVAIDAADQVIDTVSVGITAAAPAQIAFGFDGSMWFAHPDAAALVRVDPTGSVDTMVAGGSAVAPAGIACAPFLFHATFQGGLDEPDDGRRKVHGQALLALYAGSGQAFVALDEHNGDGAEMNELFDNRVMEFFGFRVNSTNAQLGMQHGSLLSPTPLQHGAGSLVLDLRMKNGTFQPKKMRAWLHRASPAGVLKLNLRMKFLINH